MGLLRIFGLISIVLSAIVGAVAYGQGTPVGALVPMAFGSAALAAILPFPAYERVRRGRVMAACLFYTAASVLSFAIANAIDPSIVTLTLGIPVSTGALLSIWSWRTRKRRRVVGFANYYNV